MKAIELNVGFNEGFFNTEIVLESICLSPKTNEQSKLFEEITAKYFNIKEERGLKKKIKKQKKKKL